jgi:uncharacterized protein YbdZ (MbtH family)
MVINNLDLMGSAVFPDKANTPLVVNTDAVLTLAPTTQYLPAGWPARKKQGLQRAPAPWVKTTGGVFNFLSTLGDFKVEML